MEPHIGRQNTEEVCHIDVLLGLPGKTSLIQLEGRA